MHRLRARVLSGAVWMVLARVISRLLGVVNIMILARLLLPDDYGLVAQAWTALLVLSIVTSFGLDIVLIQKPSIEREDLNTAFTLGLLLNSTMAAVGIALAPAVAGFFGDERLIPVIRLLSASMILGGLRNIGVVEFQRELRFSKTFLLDVVPGLAALIVTMVTAFLLRNYWALVAGTVTSVFVDLCLGYVIHPYRPRLGLRRLRSFLVFSKWIVVNNVLGYLDTRFADLLIARYLGATELGLFRVASQTASMMTSELVAPINRVLFPAYAKVAGDPDAFRRVYLRTIAVLAFVGIPVTFGLNAVAGPFVAVFLGAKWTQAAPIIELLALNGTLSILASSDYAVYMALGRPRFVVLLYSIYLGVLLPLLFLLTREYGIVGSALAFVFANLVATPLNFFVLFRTLSIRFLDFARVLWRTLIASLAMTWLVRSFTPYAEVRFASEVPVLLLSVGLGGCVFFAVAFGLWLLTGASGGAEGEVLGILRSRLKTVVEKHAG